MKHGGGSISLKLFGNLNIMHGDVSILVKKTCRSLNMKHGGSNILSKTLREPKYETWWW